LKSHLTNENQPEKAILIGVEPKNVPLKTNQVYLDELEFLAYTAGAQCIKRFTQRLEYPNPKTYIGKGKIEEVTAFVKEQDIDLAIFDDELSPSQIRNLEESFQCKIIDRSGLILDIFAKKRTDRSITYSGRTSTNRISNSHALPVCGPTCKNKKGV